MGTVLVAYYDAECVRCGWKHRVMYGADLGTQIAHTLAYARHANATTGRCTAFPDEIREQSHLPPQRIQRKRTKGWRMPEGAVYVGRPTKWGNPHTLANCNGSAVLAVQRYRFWLERGISHSLYGFPPQHAEIRQLRGHDLACWCRLDQPCHADVLLELANAE